MLSVLSAFPAAVSALAAALALWACPAAGSLFAPAPVELPLRFPALPGAWALLSRESGVEWTAVCAGGTVDAVRRSVTVPASRIVPVAGLPYVTFGGERCCLRPAGCVYPYHLSADGELELSWRDGFAASVLLELASRSFPLEGLNVRRLLEDAAAACPDPWELDREVLLEAVLSGTVNGRAVKRMAGFPVSLPFPDGVWLPDSVFGETAVSVNGTLTLERLSAGTHRFFRIDGAPSTATVRMNKDGSAATSWPQQADRGPPAATEAR